MQLGISIDGRSMDARESHYLNLEPAGAAIRAQPGRFDAFVGSYRWSARWTVRQQGRELRLSALQVHSDGLRLKLVDGAGRHWLRIGAGHPQLSADAKYLVLTGAELRIGPALAGWLGAPELDDQPIAMVMGRFAVSGSNQIAPFAQQAKGCPVPARWPGTPIDPGNPQLGNYQADVLLLSITRMRFLRCRQLAAPEQSCDGPGGAESEIAMGIDAILQNSNRADSADVPWYPKFLGQLPPYNNDQHPYLVWNLYRADADGYLAQIGRSGLKHAFVTINNGCTLGCPPPLPANANQVLYPNCSDSYTVATNDTNEFLGPRAELIPASGVWGRCGSVFDPDCDGTANPVDHQPYQHRLVVRESAIDPAEHPGARYFQDGWYVVRDDIDIDNTMGTREITPSFAVGVWSMQFVDAKLASGPLVKRWAFEPIVDGARSLSRERSAEGEVALAARVERMGPGQWRYRYVLANLDYARVATSGSNPNVRVDGERGIAALLIPQLAGTAGAPGFRDGNPNSADWVAQLSASSVRWPAPDQTSQLRWGNLLSFGFDSDEPPGYASATIELGGSPGVSSLSMRTLVPGGELLADGFE